ncbi:MAG: hypothetical protein HY680_10255 [Chloroflexi bacterium]|nr:hypothetical protein [Chloroflexota bacterium]
MGPSDVFWIAALTAPDLAAMPLCDREGGQPSFRAGPFLGERLRYRRSGACLVAAEKRAGNGLVSLRRSGGPTAWQVDHLALPQEGDSPLCDLLAAASAYAARRGAERLFLHLPEEWDIQKEACRSGFTVSSQVLLMILRGRRALAGDTPALALRRRAPADDLSLFRLHNACTPAEVRYKVGLTLQQWKDAQAPRSRSTRELVLTQDGQSRAWLRLDRHRRWTKVRMEVHPDYPIDMQSVVGYLARLSPQRGILWEVPEYQGWLHFALERMGFEVSGCYRLLVRSLAPMVREPAWAPAPTSV